MKSPCHKIPILVRTYRIDGSGRRILEREELLRDDPKNGVYDLTQWYKKYAPFRNSHTSGKRFPSRYRQSRNVWYAKKPGGSSYTPFPPMTEAEQKEFDDFFMTQRGLYLDFIGSKILEKALRDDLKLDALDAIYDGVRAAYFRYDPERPPKYRPENCAKPKSASRETFFARVARNTLSDFIDLVNAEKRGGGVTHLSISSKPDDETNSDEVSAECLADDRRNTVRDMEFRLDVEILRSHLPLRLRIVLDMLLEEWPHSLIRQRLAVSHDKYLRRYLSPIQKLAADYGFEPFNDDMFIDKMYVFHRKLRKMRRERDRKRGR